MPYENWFDTEENRTLVAICTRKLIANIGIGGTIWGGVNIVLGMLAMLASFLNAGIVLLGILMLSTGIFALRRPSLGVLLAEALVTGGLLAWNTGIVVVNSVAGGPINPMGIVFPLIVTGVFLSHYAKLQHVRRHIAAVNPLQLRHTKALCKQLLKKRLKDEPHVVQTLDRKCRAQLMEDQGFFVQRDMMRAFVATREQIERLVNNPNAKSLKLKIQHPLGRLVYAFDRKNSEKLKAWLAADEQPAAA